MAEETYHYRVFALNQHGISPVSDVVDGTTAASWVPERPTNLTAEVGGSGPIADVAADLADHAGLGRAGGPRWGSGKKLRGPVLRGRQCVGPGARGGRAGRQAHDADRGPGHPGGRSRVSIPESARRTPWATAAGLPPPRPRPRLARFPVQPDTSHIHAGRSALWN